MQAFPINEISNLGLENLGQINNINQMVTLPEW